MDYSRCRQLHITPHSRIGLTPSVADVGSKKRLLRQPPSELRECERRYVKLFEGTEKTEMNGEIHHLLLLASYANMFLLKNILEIPKPYDNNKQYNVKFIKSKHRTILSRLVSGSVSFDTISWFKDIKRRNCIGVKILNGRSTNDERITSAYVGGGRRWGIICLYNSTTELWTPGWELESKPPNTKWEITYNMSKLKFDIDSFNFNHSVNIDALSERLKISLSNISKLAEEIGEVPWKDNFFDKGLKILEGKIVEENKLPNIYSNQAQRIVSAVYSAWVFGGMGSWNDSPPYSAHTHGKETEFNLLSGNLYETMMDCIEGAINSLVTR